MSNAPLEGRVAVVTGAAQGIGRAYAQAMADDGAIVVIADLKAEAAASAAAEIVAGGGSATSVAVDVGDEASVKSMAESIRASHGRADILVNNAAIYEDVQPLTLTETPLDYWRHLFAVNVESCLTCSRELVPMMRDHGWGRIVNQGSVGAYMGNPSAYAVSKLAVVGVT
jgi:NAD(P)-dependent dehydrogenase (short-subunit alcohol dehydrogenase family)